MVYFYGYYSDSEYKIKVNSRFSIFTNMEFASGDVYTKTKWLLYKAHPMYNTRSRPVWAMFKVEASSGGHCTMVWPTV